MTTELQEQFISYVFEDVKANLDAWDANSCFEYEKVKRNFRDKIIELRRQYAKAKGLKTVTQVCPKPSDLVYPIREFMREHIESERARIVEEYKPLAIAKVVNDETFRDELNKTLAKNFLEYDPYRNWGDPLKSSYSELMDSLSNHYDEIKHTLSNPANAVKPFFYNLAKELLISLFTVSLTLKDSYLSAYGDFETIEEAS